MNAKEAKNAMLIPRYTRAGRGYVRGWFYINSDSVAVLASSTDGKTPCVKLTRRQLEHALAVMKTAGNGN